jgi:hypothetical protein
MATLYSWHNEATLASPQGITFGGFATRDPDDDGGLSAIRTDTANTHTNQTLHQFTGLPVGSYYRITARTSQLGGGASFIYAVFQSVTQHITLDFNVGFYWSGLVVGPVGADGLMTIKSDFDIAIAELDIVDWDPTATNVFNWNNESTIKSDEGLTIWKDGGNGSNRVNLAAADGPSGENTLLTQNLLGGGAGQVCAPFLGIPNGTVVNIHMRSQERDGAGCLLIARVQSGDTTINDSTNSAWETFDRQVTVGSDKMLTLVSDFRLAIVDLNITLDVPDNAVPVILLGGL